MKQKRKVIIVLAICILIVASNFLIVKTRPILPDDEFAFSPTPQNGQAGGIEGVYYHRASSLTELLEELSCKSEGWDSCTTYQLIRFYNDGTVLEVPIATDDGINDGDLPKLQKWLNSENKEIPNGKYFISGNKIWFSTSVYYDDNGSTVTSDFSGFVIGNMLILDVYSHYNGKELNTMMFVRLNEGTSK